ncbi:unnamed protein product [Closterium sp. NIES-65]|nr:unnamed protein product [Closterium sp. NIES-65]
MLIPSGAATVVCAAVALTATSLAPTYPFAVIPSLLAGLGSVEGGGGGLGGGEVDNGGAKFDFGVYDPLLNGGEIGHGIGLSKGVKAGFIVWGEVKQEAMDLEVFREAGLAGFEAISYFSHTSDIVDRSVTCSEGDRKVLLKEDANRADVAALKHGMEFGPNDQGTEFPSLEAAHKGVRESTEENGAGAGVSSCPGDEVWGKGSQVVRVFGDDGKMSIAASNCLVIGFNCCIVLGFADKHSYDSFYDAFTSAPCPHPAAATPGLLPPFFFPLSAIPPPSSPPFSALSLRSSAASTPPPRQRRRGLASRCRPRSSPPRPRHRLRASPPPHQPPPAPLRGLDAASALAPPRPRQPPPPAPFPSPASTPPPRLAAASPAAAARALPLRDLDAASAPRCGLTSCRPRHSAASSAAAARALPLRGLDAASAPRRGLASRCARYPAASTPPPRQRRRGLASRRRPRPSPTRPRRRLRASPRPRQPPPTLLRGLDAASAPAPPRPRQPPPPAPFPYAPPTPPPRLVAASPATAARAPPLRGLDAASAPAPPRPQQPLPPAPFPYADSSPPLLTPRRDHCGSTRGHPSWLTPHPPPSPLPPPIDTSSIDKLQLAADKSAVNWHSFIGSIRRVLSDAWVPPYRVLDVILRRPHALPPHRS